MTRAHLFLGTAVVALAGGSGCARSCGDYDHQTGLVWDLEGDDDPPEAVDDYTQFEWCGAQNGSIGWRDQMGDGVAHLWFDGTHRNSHVAITVASGIMLDVYFQSTALEVGRTLTTPDLVGQSGIFDTEAYYLDVDGMAYSGALVTDAEIEFLDVKHDPFWETDAYRVRFDVTYGEPGVSEFWYTAVGEDWISFL